MPNQSPPQSRSNPPARNPLDRALEVLEDDPELHPEVPETLLARNPANGLPLWWPTFNPDNGQAWKSLEESRSALLDRIQRTLPAVSLQKTLQPTERPSVVNALHRIALELRSMGFDTPE